MNQETLSYALNDLDEDLIAETDRLRQRTEFDKRRLMRWSAAAACLCLVLLGVWAARRAGTVNHPMLVWNGGFPAEDYFKYSGTDTGGVSSIVEADSQFIAPFAETRVFSDQREELEAEGVIPVVNTHPLFNCSAHYNEDGSLYSLELGWRRRDGDYSDLSITAGYQEVPQITDCIFVEIDENGNIVEPSVTVTGRDGVQIVAEGRPNQSKTLTFQNDTGWYQIKGSWNDSYESVAALLDWLWEHPLDFTRFPINAGDKYDHLYEEGGLADIPEAFAAHVPDLAALGYETEAQWLTLKNGEPVYFEGSYRSDGVPSLSWSVNAEPDYEDRQRVVGVLEDLTCDLVAEIRSRDQNIYFTWDGYVVAVYIGNKGTADDLWQVIKSAQG